MGNLFSVSAKIEPTKERTPLTPDHDTKTCHERPEDELQVVSKATKSDGRQMRKYPTVGVCSRIGDFSPEEALAKSVSNGLALPVYEVNCRNRDLW